MKNTNRIFERASELFWFGFVIGFLLLMGEVVDEVRHGHENLMVGFLVPLWGFAAFFATLISRLLWMIFPALAPRHHATRRSNWSVVGAVCLTLAIGVIWSKSPLFAAIYDSCKIILTLQIAGLMLGLIYLTGGWRNTLTAFLIALVAAAIAGGALLAFAYFTAPADAPNTTEIARALIAGGIPLAIVMALFDYLRHAQFAPNKFTSPAALAR